MLSTTYFKMIAVITVVGRKVGASNLVLDVHNAFHITTDPKCLKRFKSSYNMLCLWLLTGFFLIPKFWFEHNIERYTLSIFYFLGGSAMVLVMFSILRWYSSDGCRVINGLFGFLRY